VLVRAAMARTQLGGGREAAELDRLIDALPTVTSHEAGARARELAELDARVEEHRAAVAADTAGAGRLVAVLGATDVDREVLALAVAVAESPARLALVRWIEGDRTAAGIAAGHLTELLGGAAWRSVAPDSVLVRHGVLEVLDADAGGAAVVRAPAAVLLAVLGVPAEDPHLPVAVEARAGERRAGRGRWAVHGADRVLRHRAAVEAVGTGRLLVTTEPEHDHEWVGLVRTACLTGAAVVLELDDTLTPAARRQLRRADRIAWVLSSPHPVPLADLPVGGVVEIEARDEPVPGAEVEALLGEPAHGRILRREQLDLLGRVAAVDGHRALRRLAGGELDRLAQRIRPERTWDDLVLDADRMAKVREVAHRVRHRATVFDEWGFRRSPSTGVIALFTGPPGTGKTISAEVIANDLGVDAFRVDLASVVSKYIGETEKHLERVFAAAESAGVVLLFDEADAIFGKRTNVQDSNDRYANLETSYLLQRIERYDGVTVLTSNLAKNIDEAFLRRIHVAVEFPMPEETERRSIWIKCFPPGVPLGDLDVDGLAARFRIAGGSIRSAALTAAFAAAEEGAPVEMRHVLHGLRREYQKLGRLITAEDFGAFADA
jgi:AAA+ superfamily predicted ATPase